MKGRFCFNFYQHHALLINHGAIGKAVMISSHEGITQGYPLSVICYRIGTLLPIRNLKREFPAAKQRWFAVDGSTAADIRAQLERLQQLGPNYGYFQNRRRAS